MTGPDGGWVEQRFGASLVDLPGAAPPVVLDPAGVPNGPGAPVGVNVPDRVNGLVRLALRRNPRRAQLLVSTVLGKHLPADPVQVREHGIRLGAAVAHQLGSQPAVVVGFAETATALGHLVAERLGAGYLHSTRRLVPVAGVAGGFEEEHSHASGHLLLPEDPGLLAGDEALVLVDDELSTGRTAANMIRALHRSGRRRYLIATLVDLRSAADSAALEGIAAGLGVSIEVIALARGALDVPGRFATDAAALVAAAPGPPDAPGTVGPTDPAPVVAHPPCWRVGVRDGGRHGFGPADVAAAHAAAAQVARELTPWLGAGPVLVLGSEELMYAPILVACALAGSGADVRVSSTTRSPVMVLDEPGYPIRSAIAYTGGSDAEGGAGPRFAYNVRDFTDVILVSDVDPAPGLVDGLRRGCDRLHLVDIPSHRPSPAPLRGPEFGSYRPEEVAWLLTDLAGAALEAPVEEREEAIQSGGAHYAESLPVEYQPDAEYRALYQAALRDSADRVAQAVGTVTELVLHERGPRPVLVSLARAGTPIGVLMRRWARFTRGIELAHYAISIVRGRGIDTQALRHLAARYDPADIVFVDGWTGKGAITTELAAAVTAVNADWGTRFDPALTVLADPGSCVTTFGTREDFLVPSACLNSTVSGLVSRTVLNGTLLGPEAFHGAKFYAELADVDVSNEFLDAVSARFAEVRGSVDARWPQLLAGDRTATWAGRREVERLVREYGVGDPNLVKPGVGETTRVLLRRVPWAVLMRPGADADLAHVRLLAERRDVPIRIDERLTFSCVGLIHPRFTRGATGSDGRRAVGR